MKLILYKQEFNEFMGKSEMRRREFDDILLVKIIKEEQKETFLNISMYDKKDIPLDVINNDKIHRILIT